MQDRIKATQPEPKIFKEQEIKDMSDRVPDIKEVLANLDSALELAQSFEKERRWTYSFRRKKTTEDCWC